MCFSMQAFLNARAELAAERELPEEVVAALATDLGWPPIASAEKMPAQGQDEIFLVKFERDAPEKLAPTGAYGDRRHAVLHIIGSQLGLSPIFAPDAMASVKSVTRALEVARAAGAAAPHVWLSGELVRRGALRRLGFVLLERVVGAPSPPTAAADDSLTVPATAELRGLPAYSDVPSLIKELRRLAVLAGATELDAPLARLAEACLSGDCSVEPQPARLLLRSGEEGGGGAEDAVAMDATDGAAPPRSQSAAVGSPASWTSAAVGDVRIMSGEGEPWDLIRAFSHIVKVRWLIDLLRRTPGRAPRCDLPALLQAHDRAQNMLAGRGWLPTAIVAPGSSSAKLAETFPEEMCPNY